MSRFGTSQPLSRLEDPRLLLGAGRYIDDAAPQDGLERALHAVFVRSPVAHAEIAAIDLAAARASSGVAAIFTGADLSREGVNHMARGNLAGREGTAAAACPVRPLLAGDKVRHVGEAIALVLAETPEAARDLAITGYGGGGEERKLPPAPPETQQALKHGGSLKPRWKEMFRCLDSVQANP